MATTRRVGKQDSATRTTILRSAARLMVESGYAAVTHRGVARRADVTPSLVQYYFPALDDLFVALINFQSDLAIAGLQAAATSSRPLHEMWEQARNPAATALIVEFMALANHRPAVRGPMGEVGERIRQAQAAVLSQRAASGGGTSDWTLPPEALIFILTALPRMAIIEETYGVDTGHAATLEFVQRRLDDAEPADEQLKSR
jgi:AcrR family transcriptional regulator